MLYAHVVLAVCSGAAAHQREGQPEGTNSGTGMAHWPWCTRTERNESGSTWFGTGVVEMAQMFVVRTGSGR